MEVKRLREKGHRVTLLNEAQFWRLAKERAQRCLETRYLRARLHNQGLSSARFTKPEDVVSWLGAVQAQD